MTLYVVPDPHLPVVHLRARGESDQGHVGDFYLAVAPGGELFGLSYDEWRQRAGPVNVSEDGKVL